MKKTSITIPIFEGVSILSGFYLGYSESKGIPVSDFKTLFYSGFPSILSFGVTGILGSVGNYFRKYKDKILERDFLVSIKGEQKLFSSLSSSEKKHIKSKISQLEKTLSKNESVFESSVKSGIYTGCWTFLGYSMGKIAGDFI